MRVALRVLTGQGSRVGAMRSIMAIFGHYLTIRSDENRQAAATKL
jgi:hypothetical protein